MNLSEQITRAFAHRAKPSSTVHTDAAATCDVADAKWFVDRNYSSITWNDWIDHSSAFYTFHPLAFAYYLPSILLLSAARPNEWFAPADSLLQILDRSPVVANWDNFLRTRLIGLTSDEYAAIKSWLLYLSSGSMYQEQIDRAFDTMDLLEMETLRLRRVIGCGN